MWFPETCQVSQKASDILRVFVVIVLVAPFNRVPQCPRNAPVTQHQPIQHLDLLSRDLGFVACENRNVSNVQLIRGDVPIRGENLVVWGARHGGIVALSGLLELYTEPLVCLACCEGVPFRDCFDGCPRSVKANEFVTLPDRVDFLL